MMSRISSSGAVLALSLAIAAALQGCGGTDDQQSAPHPVVVNQLFLEDPHSGKIAAFTSASPASGTAFSDHVVAGVANANGPMAYDATRDELYVAVSNPSNPAATIQVFDRAGAMTAGTPSRTITFEHGVTSLVRITKLVVDPTTDTLWAYGLNGSGLIEIASGTLMIVSHASTVTSPVPLAGSVGVTAGSNATSFAYDAGRDVAFVTGATDASDTAVPGVAVYAAASTTFGTGGLERPTSTLAIAGAADIAFDASHDILYVADPQHGLWIVQQASTANPVLVGPIAMAQVNSVSVDATNDRLVVGAGTSAYVFDDASTLAGGSSFPPATVVTAGSSDSISSAAFR